MRKSAMISDFSSTLNGTLIIPPLCLDSREPSHSHYSMQHDRSPAIHLLWVFLLLNSNLCANLGHFLRDLLCFFLGDRFFNCRGRLVNDCFCLFQAKTCNLTYNFDDVDLVWANL